MTEIRDVAAIVTGGASGLGEATVRALAAAGAWVTIADRDAARGTDLAAELGSRVAFAGVDVTDDEQIGAAVSAAAASAPLRIAVSCAGVGGGVRTLDRERKVHSRGVWDRIVRINLDGTFLLLSHAAAHIAETDPVDSNGQRGVIVNTASIAAFEGQIGQLAYAASKAGVVGLTLPAARDLADVGVRVCAIAPGMMDTPMLARLGDEARRSLTADVVHPNRFGEPSEFAALVLAIIGNDYMNGEVIRLDGALRMAPR